MQNTNESYNKAHSYLLQNAKGLPSEPLELKRNTLLHSYFASLNSKTCLLTFDEDLKEYSNLVSEKSVSIDQKIIALLASSQKLSIENTGLNSTAFAKYMAKLPCSENETYCSQSETISTNDFQQFLSSFNCNANGSVSKSHNSKRHNSNERFVPPENPKENDKRKSSFITATEDYKNKTGKSLGIGNNTRQENDSSKRLGLSNNTGIRRRLGVGANSAIRKSFKSPVLSNSDLNNLDDALPKSQDDILEDERYKNIDSKMIELIKNEIMDCGTLITWDDIAGLEFAKNAIKEAVVWPMLRPDIFTGLRRPPKGILLFGPPGTGKTLIGKCVASQSKSTFFSISASSLTSKWIGDGEKMVRALFVVARVHQPSVIFIDEVDSLLSQRSDQEHESSRRLKTEFLVQLDGATTDSEDRILLIGATNRPQELDEAARRRFVKRLYIPLPEYEARLQLVKKLMSSETVSLLEDDFQDISNLSNGYSGADIRNLCSEASLGPIRSIDISQMQTISAHEVRPIEMQDFQQAFKRIRSSVAPSDLQQYITWDKTYGSGL